MDQCAKNEKSGCQCNWHTTWYYPFQEHINAVSSSPESVEFFNRMFNELCMLQEELSLRNWDERAMLLNKMIQEPSSYIDTQSGAFTQEEINNSTSWR